MRSGRSDPGRRIFRHRIRQRNARERFIFSGAAAFFQPYRRVVYLPLQTVKLADMLQLKSLQDGPHTGQMLFSLVEFPEVAVGEYESTHHLLQALAQARQDFHPGMHRLRPEAAPLVCKQYFQYRQPFAEPVQPGKLRTCQSVPSGGLQLHPILTEQAEAQALYLLPVDVRARRVGQLTEFIAKLRIVRQGTGVAAGPQVLRGTVRHQ
ncbi:hypothetical protein D3C85_1320570 [compost metagenome]